MADPGTNEKGTVRRTDEIDLGQVYGIPKLAHKTSGFLCFLGEGNYSQRSMGFLGSLKIYCWIVDNHKGPWLAQGL